ncbi:hypothetical protein HDU82_006518 [Entophlyctis luteolus]|nr:hypothetical protein HDU82_006518 [Entophlyctis luteolus]
MAATASAPRTETNSSHGPQHLHNLAASVDGTTSLRGSWLGVTATGRFAFLTNIRGAHSENQNAKSRGFLVSNFLASTQSPQAYLKDVSIRSNEYNGFNLVVGDLRSGEVWYFGNRMNGDDRYVENHGAEEEQIRQVAVDCDAPVRLCPGTIYALSNATLFTGREWHKVAHGTKLFRDAINIDHELAINSDAHSPSQEVVDQQVLLEIRNAVLDRMLSVLRYHLTRLLQKCFTSQKFLLRTRDTSSNPPPSASDMEKHLNPICINQKRGYGTRTHTVICVDIEGRGKFIEIDRYIVDKSVTHHPTGELIDPLSASEIKFNEQIQEFEFFLGTKNDERT